MRSFFKIRKGIVGVSRILDDGRRQIVAIRAPGDCVGYLEESGNYAFEGQALTDVEACAFDRRGFDNFAAKHSDLALATTETLSAALRQAGQAMLVLGQLNSTERVANFLVEIDTLYRDRHVHKTGLALFMTRREVADYLGLRIETVSRVLGSLKRSRIIEVAEADRIVITDRARLRDIGKL